jgi:hypothetical protein
MFYTHERAKLRKLTVSIDEGFVLVVDIPDALNSIFYVHFKILQNTHPKIYPHPPPPLP